MTEQFSAADHELIHRLGRARQATKELHGIADGKRADRSGVTVHVQGVAAELLVARALGGTLDERVGPRGHRGIAFAVNGVRVSVQSNRYQGGDLRFFPGKVPHADIFVLVTGSYPGPLTLTGWATRAQILAGHEAHELPRQGVRWLYPRASLLPIAALFTHLGITPPRQPLPPVDSAPAVSGTAPVVVQGRLF